MAEHPITPPPSVIDYLNRAVLDGRMDRWDSLEAAYRAGADAELEACCEWLREAKHHGLGDEVAVMLAGRLRAAMRPKPPSLAEEARAKLDEAVMRGDCISTTTAMPILRAALERLQELESNG